MLMRGQWVYMFVDVCLLLASTYHMESYETLLFNSYTRWGV